MSNLMGWMLPLTKQRCCKAVVAALRKYDPSKYGTLKFNDQKQLHIVPYEDAIAALRVAVRKTGKPKFRTALSILEEPRRMIKRQHRQARAC
jgi:hypothetical protein